VSSQTHHTVRCDTRIRNVTLDVCRIIFKAQKVPSDVDVAVPKRKADLIEVR
jgi:hypothetical protein